MKNVLPKNLAFLLLGFSAIFASCQSDNDTVNLNQESLSPDNSMVWQKVTSEIPKAPQLNKSGDEVVFTLEGFYLGKKTIDGKIYTQIRVPGHSPLTRNGYPELPKVRTNIIIPSQAQMDPIIVDSRYYDISINPPLPSRGDITRDVDPSTVPYIPSQFYTTGSQYPETPFFADNTFIVRDHRGLPLQFQPFIYLRAQKRLRVYTYLRIKLNTSASIPYSGQIVQSPDFVDLYAKLFLNYAEVNPFYSPIHESGRMIIITADAFYSAAATLAEWKNQRGLPTEIVELSTIGNSAEAIKAFIKSRYEAPESLTYVILMGDSDTIPTLGGTHEGAHSDPSYAMVAGNDVYPDLFISRISARSLEQAETQVAKFIRYEKEPDTEDAADWYLRAINVASNQSGSSSLKDWQRAEELRTALEDYGYTSVAQIYDPNASKNALIEAINNGASVFNYIGHGLGTSWPTTKFSVSDIPQLHNGMKQPLIIDVACQNGSFVNNETSLAEAFLRAGSKEDPAGAIAVYASSTNASWVPPTEMQAHIIKDLYVKEIRTTIGSLYFSGGMQVIDQYPKDEGIKLIEQYNIFGDASLMIRTKPAKGIKVEHPDTVPGSGIIEVVVKSDDDQPLPNATVTLFNQDIVASALTNGNGIATLSYDNAGSRNARLTVFGFNRVPYIKELPIVGAGKNRQPLAKVGQDQTVKIGTLVTLDGSRSKDPDGDLLIFKWTQTDGPIVTLKNTTDVKPTFIAPEVTTDTTLTFRLVVSDDKLESEPVLTKVVVKGPEIEIIKASADTPIAIPDSKPAGITSSITVEEEGVINSADVDVDITHTYIGDLVVKLECPTGEVITLHKREGGSADDLKKTYAIEGCNGKSAKGTWKLQVSDLLSSYKGTLNHWKLTVRIPKTVPPTPGSN